ncbi:MAG TPA: DDE transposase [Firmicutes bacterium]|nr:DDE transposase [Bacillota bacterium]
MAIIPQRSLFGWKDVEELGDLERLVLVLESLPDEALVKGMEIARFKGRDDYPVRAVWNSILAGLVYQHPTIASLRRELQRNAQLRQVCGFDLWKGLAAVPPDYVYSRFLRKLMNEYSHFVDEMFNELVGILTELLPDFGGTLALDGKAIQSFASRKSEEKPDGRRDVDGDWGKKAYKGVRKDGSPWEKVTSWFGYRLHLIVDSKYELPVHFRLTKASLSEVKQAHGMIDDLAILHPMIAERCCEFTADRGYDDGKLVAKLWDEHKIKPIIDIRNCWQDPDPTRLLGNYPNVAHDYKGTIYCYCPEEGTQREMAFGGFEKDRETLKYRCPAKQYGISCPGHNHCPAAAGIRIKLAENRRIFTPLARSSYAWERAYDKRTSVERVNSRLDGFFGFENHTIRGQKKMEVRCGLSLCIMLAMAAGRIRQQKPELMRSMVTSA